MAVIWPATIPGPVNGFQLEQTDVSARTGNQFGVKTTRRRMTNAPAAITLSFILTAAEKSALDTFYETTTNAGCMHFTADWLSHALSPHHCAKIEDYSSVIIGRNSSGILYQASLSIAVFDKGEIIEGYLHPWYDVNGV